MNDLEKQMEVIRRQLTTLSDSIHVNGRGFRDEHKLCAIGACIISLVTLKNMIDEKATIADCVQLEDERLAMISDAKRYMVADAKAIAHLNRKAYSDRALKELK